VLAALSGVLGLPGFLRLGNAIDEFLHPVFAGSLVVPPESESVAVEGGLMGLSLVVVGAGFFAAYWIYIRNWGLAARMTKSAQWLYDLVYNKYYVDEGYMEAIVKPLRALAALLNTAVEERSIDAAVNGLGRLFGRAGEGLRRLQSGLVRHYALALLAGAVGIVIYFLLRGLLGF
jgi:NADH-quinone oxidoreductase subunit L